MIIIRLLQIKVNANIFYQMRSGSRMVTGTGVGLMEGVRRVVWVSVRLSRDAIFMSTVVYLNP